MSVFEKINLEMQKDPQNKYLEIIGQYVLDRCLDEKDAAKVADEKKTLADAMQKVLQEAGKKKKGNVAVLMPAEVFAVVDQYFGFETDEEAQFAAMSGEAPTRKPTAGVIDISSFF